MHVGVEGCGHYQGTPKKSYKKLQFTKFNYGLIFLSYYILSLK